MREEIIVIQNIEKNMLHFTGELAGVTNEAWYPINRDGLFKSIEFYLTESGIANNVVDVQEIRACGGSIDHKATFNRIL